MANKELKSTLIEERILYLGTNRKRIMHMRLSRHKRYSIWRAVYYFRWAQYYCTLRSDAAVSAMKRRFAKLLFRYYDRKRNLSGAFAGIEIGLNSNVGKGVNIWHGGVVINGTLGENCILHGNNVIGNKGTGSKQTPVIGSGADIGAGAILIGDIRIADGCVIGAGAVVTKSCETPGKILAGVPAKSIGNIAERKN
ncbi:MAG: hypothetical protein IJK40_10130 [Clostridia bacterium]|nr:hypothetical protein [Clostridia bacterium]